MGNNAFAPINTGPKIKSGIKVSKKVKQFIPKQTIQKQVIAKPAASKKNVETFVSTVPRSTASSFPNYFSKPKPLNYSKIREKNIEAKKRDVETSKDTKIIAEILMQIKGEKSPELGYGYILSIQGLEQRDRDFISAVKTKKFPDFCELHVRNLARFNQKETRDLNEFFEKSMPNTLGNMILNSKSKTTDISPYIESLKTAMRCVANKIGLSHFIMDDKTFALALESGRDTKKIIFTSCELMITKNLTLNSNYRYKIKEIHFLDTCKKLKRKEIDYDKFTLIIEALGKTNLTDSLEMCAIQNIEFNQKIIEDIFKVCGFDKIKIFNDLEEAKHYTAFQKRIEERKVQYKE